MKKVNLKFKGNNIDSFATFVGIVLILIFAALITPFLFFGVGWLTGLVIKLTFGNLFIRGVSLLNINISLSQIPLFCGILGIIGSFFRNSNINKGE